MYQQVYHGRKSPVGESGYAAIPAHVNGRRAFTVLVRRVLASEFAKLGRTVSDILISSIASLFPAFGKPPSVHAARFKVGARK